MNDAPLRTGTCRLAPEDYQPDGSAVDAENAGYFACRDADQVWAEVMGPRLEREQQREADDAAGRPRSRFL